MIENFKDSDYAGIINELCPELKDTVPGQPLHSKRLPFLRNVVTVDESHPLINTLNRHGLRKLCLLYTSRCV